MTGPVSIPRYSAEDLETASIRSAAPSYVSDAPSYHSTVQHAESAPAYAPRAGPSSADPRAGNETSTPRARIAGLPPIPPASPPSVVALHNFRIPTWSANNAPAARQYRNVAQRRVTDGRYPRADASKRHGPGDRALDNNHDPGLPPLRPLEDPYLVGEVAAEQARRERLAREAGDDVLIREGRQWDWLLAQMKDWDERDKSWTRFRREVETSQRRKLLNRIGGRLLP